MSLQRNIKTVLPKSDLNIELFSQIEGLLHDKICQDDPKAGIKLLMLGAFGSRTKGYDHPNSDYDFYAIYSMNDWMAQRALFATQEFFEHKHPDPNAEVVISLRQDTEGVAKELTIRCTSIHVWLQKLTQANYDYGLSAMYAQIWRDEFTPVLESSIVLIRNHYDYTKAYHIKLAFLRRAIAETNEGNFTKEFRSSQRAFDVAHALLLILAIRFESEYFKNHKSTPTSHGIYTGIEQLKYYILELCESPFIKEQLQLVAFANFILEELRIYRSLPAQTDYDHIQLFRRLRDGIVPMMPYLSAFHAQPGDEFIKTKREGTAAVYNAARLMNHNPVRTS